MEIDDATVVQRCALEAIESLARSLVHIQEKCAEAEFNAYRRHVADIIGRIQSTILNPLYADHPALDELKTKTGSE